MSNEGVLRGLSLAMMIQNPRSYVGGATTGVSEPQSSNVLTRGIPIQNAAILQPPGPEPPDHEPV